MMKHLIKSRAEPSSRAHWVMHFFLAGLVVLLPFCTTVFSQSTPTATITVKEYFYDTSAGIYLNKGNYPVTASVMRGDTALWVEKQTQDIAFGNSGYFQLTLGSVKELPISVFNYSDVYLKLDVQNRIATFSFRSMPYSLHSKLAEKALSGEAENIVGEFENMSISNRLNIFNGLFSVDGDPKTSPAGVGILAEPKKNHFIVGGSVNATDLRINTQPYTNVFSWKSSPSPNAIYTNKPIGIKAFQPVYNVHVYNDILNADQFLINGSPINADFYWSTVNVPIKSLSYSQDGYIGMGREFPKAKLDVKGAILLYTSPHKLAGNMRWVSEENFKDFQMAIDDLDENQNPTVNWKSVIGISGSGTAGQFSRWIERDDRMELDNITGMYYDPSSFHVGLNTSSINAHLHIHDSSNKSSLLVSDANNEPILFVGPTSSATASNQSVGVGTTLPNYALDVSGNIHSYEYYKNGTLLRLSMSGATYWSRKDNNVYYNWGNVGIGRPDPDSLLEISAPNKDPLTEALNPSITFTSAIGTPQAVSYTLGVDSKQKDTFRFEKGIALGENPPVFVAQNDRFGVGLEQPKTNMHILGNDGAIFSGTFDSQASFNITLPNNHFFFYPEYGALRFGVSDAGSAIGGPYIRPNTIGRFSMAFGYNQSASGNLSSAIGGSQNTVFGAYGTSIGGASKTVNGDFALGLGSNMKALHHGSFVWGDSQPGPVLETTHENQFLIRSLNGIGINTNQTFYERYGNFTNSVLTVQSPDSDSDPIQFIGANDTPVLTLKPDGKVFMGNNITSSDFKLTILDKKLSINNPSINALVAIENVSLNANVSPNRFVFMFLGNEDIATPGFMAKHSLDRSDLVLVGTRFANVGLGLVPSEDSNFNLTNDSGVSQTPKYGFLESAGAVISTKFQFPSGEELDPRYPVVVWHYLRSTPNVYFPSANLTADGLISKSGHVGLGTTSPNFLLELSNSASKKSFISAAVDPAIQFDFDGTDVFAFGLNNSSADRLAFKHGTIKDSRVAPLSIFSDRIGILTDSPVTADIHVPHTTLVSNFLSTGYFPPRVATGSVHSPKVHASMFAVGGRLFPWYSRTLADGSTVLYHPTVFDPSAIPPVYSFVGIGHSDPQTALDVSGSVKINSAADTPSLFLSNELIIKNDVEMGPLAPRYGSVLQLKDSGAGDKGAIYIHDSDLSVVSSNPNTPLIISDFISRGDGPKGKLAFWVNYNGILQIAESPLEYYRNIGTAPFLADQVFSSQNISSYYTRNLDGNSKATARQIVDINQTSLNQPFTIQAVINTNGDLSESRSYSAKKVRLQMDTWPRIGAALTWKAPYTSQSLQALDTRFFGTQIELKSSTFQDGFKKGRQTNVSKGGYAVGLRSDVSGVNIQQFADKGLRYAAIFLSDSNDKSIVGIGGTPNAQLDVKGTLTAHSFVISQELSISSVNAEANIFSVLTKNRVGIGTSSPATELEIIGDINTRHMYSSQGIKADSLVSPLGKFIVNSEGNVGIGLTNPTNQFDLYRLFSGLEASPFTFKTITFGLGKDRDNDIFQKSLYGATLKFVTSENVTRKSRNIFGSKDTTATQIRGYDISADALVLGDNGRINGLTVLMPTKKDENATANAGIFMGGNVGIGVSNPSTALQIKGTLAASNIPRANFLSQQEVASFNFLTLGDPNDATSTGNLEIQQDKFFLEAGTVNMLVIQKLDVTGNIQLPNISVSVSENVVVENDLVTSKNGSVGSHISANILTNVDMSGKDATFDKIVVGTFAQTPAESDISTDIDGNDITVVEALTGLSVSINNTLYVPDQAVGINNLEPMRTLDVVSDRSDIDAIKRAGLPVDFDPGDTRSWNTITVQSQSGTPNFASGVVFIIGADKSTASGSGFAAIRVGCDGDAINHYSGASPCIGTDPNQIGSHLAFMTDPQSGEPVERLRIKDNGRVGIGVTSNISAPLHVSGNIIFQQNLTLPSSVTLDLNILTGDSLTLNTSTAKIMVLSTTNAQDEARFLLPLQLSAFLPTGGIESAGKLFVDPSSKLLQYSLSLDGANWITGNISPSFDVKQQSFAFFNGQYQLSPQSDYKWSQDSGYYNWAFTSANITSDVIDHIFEVPTTGTFPDQAQLYTLLLNNRNESSTSVFKGIDIVLAGNAREPNISQRDQIYGLRVTLDSKVNDRTIFPDGSLITGKKYAATFLAGPSTIALANTTPNGVVSITASDNVLVPTSVLHVRSATGMETQENYVIMRVDASSAKTHRLAVNRFGHVGMGTEGDATKRLKVVLDPNETIQFSKSTDESVILGQSDGLVSILGPTSNDTLTVAGQVSANQLILNTNGGINLDTFSTIKTTDGLHVLNTGLVGMNTKTPQAQLDGSHIYTQSQMTQDIVPYSLAIDVKEDTNGNGFLKNIDGYFISVSTNAGMQLQSTTPADEELAISAYGMRIDASGVPNIADSSQLIGVQSIVSSNYDNGEKAYAAVFEGGFVGIGVDQPAYALDINGSIQAESVAFDSAYLTLNSGTFNRLVIDDATATASIQTMESTLDSQASIRVMDMLEIDEFKLKYIEDNIDGSVAENLYKTIQTKGVIANNASINQIVIPAIAPSAGDWISAKLGQSEFPLLVSGDASITTFDVQGYVETTRITSDATLRFMASHVTLNSHVTSTEFIAADQLHIFGKSSISLGTGLWVDSSKSDLYFNSSSLGNSSFSITDGITSNITYSVPYRPNINSITGNALVRFVPNGSTYTFTVGTQNVSSTQYSHSTALNLISNGGTANFTDTTPTRTMAIDYLFGDRTGSTSTFNAMRILVSPPSDSPSAKTRPAIPVIGLRVSMNETLKEDTTYFSGSLIDGKIYSGVFLSDESTSTNVFIQSHISDTNPLRKGEAELHMVSIDETIYKGLHLLRSDLSDGTTAMIVSKNGRIGIGPFSGSTEPNAHLHILAAADRTDPILLMQSDTSTPILTLNTNGEMGIGSEAGGSTLNVSGIVSANTFSVRSSLVANSLSISQGSTSILTIPQSGFMGIGTTAPTSPLDYTLAFPTTMATPIDMIGFDHRLNSGYTNHITGIELDFRTLNGSDEDLLNADAVGMTVDLTKLTSGFTHTNGSVIGLTISGNNTAIFANHRLDLTQSNAESFLYKFSSNDSLSATFLGGFVGIGLDSPTADLDISGNILARSLLIDPDNSSAVSTLNITTANLTDLIVTNNATFGSFFSKDSNGALTPITINQTLTINSLVEVSSLILPQNSNLEATKNLSISTLNVYNGVDSKLYLGQDFTVGDKSAYAFLATNNMVFRIKGTLGVFPPDSNSGDKNLQFQTTADFDSYSGGDIAVDGSLSLIPISTINTENLDQNANNNVTINQEVVINGRMMFESDATLSRHKSSAGALNNLISDFDGTISPNAYKYIPEDHAGLFMLDHSGTLESNSDDTSTFYGYAVTPNRSNLIYFFRPTGTPPSVNRMISISGALRGPTGNIPVYKNFSELDITNHLSMENSLTINALSTGLTFAVVSSSRTASSTVPLAVAITNNVNIQTVQTKYFGDIQSSIQTPDSSVNQNQYIGSNILLADDGFSSNLSSGTGRRLYGLFIDVGNISRNASDMAAQTVPSDIAASFLVGSQASNNVVISSYDQGTSTAIQSDSMNNNSPSYSDLWVVGSPVDTQNTKTFTEFRVQGNASQLVAISQNVVISSNAATMGTYKREKVHISSAAFEPILQAHNATGRSLISIDYNNKIGFGGVTSDASLTIDPGTADLAVNIGNVSSITKEGALGIGTVTPQATLEIRTSKDNFIEFGKKVVTETADFTPIFTLHQPLNMKARLIQTTMLHQTQGSYGSSGNKPDYGVMISGNILTSTQTSFTDPARKNQFVFATDGGLKLGTFKDATDASNIKSSANITMSKPTIIRHDDNDILTITENVLIGIGTILPDATLSLKGSSLASPIFSVYNHSSEGVPTFAIIVSGNGAIGIGTTVPEYSLHIASINRQGWLGVSTDSKTMTKAVRGHQLFSDSLWVGQNHLYSKKETETPPFGEVDYDPNYSTSNLSFEINLNENKEHSGQYMSLTLQEDTSFNITGVYVRPHTSDQISGDFNKRDQLIHTYGLSVSLNELLIVNPAWTDVSGNKYAAAFMGGPVVIGKQKNIENANLPGSNGFDITPNSTLAVRAMHYGDITGLSNVNVGGSIAEFESMNGSVSSNFHIYSNINNVNSLIPANAESVFTSVADTDVGDKRVNMNGQVSISPRFFESLLTTSGLPITQAQALAIFDGLAFGANCDNSDTAVRAEVAANICADLSKKIFIRSAGAYGATSGDNANSWKPYGRLNSGTGESNPGIGTTFLRLTSNEDNVDSIFNIQAAFYNNPLISGKSGSNKSATRPSVLDDLDGSDNVFFGNSAIQASIKDLLDQIYQNQLFSFVSTGTWASATTPTASLHMISGHDAVTKNGQLMMGTARVALGLSQLYDRSSVEVYKQPAKNGVQIADQTFNLLTTIKRGTVAAEGQPDNFTVVAADEDTIIDTNGNFRGDIGSIFRVGIKDTSPGISAPGYGRKFFFSGGPLTTFGQNSAQQDTIWMARYNLGVGQSELRIALEDTNVQSPDLAFRLTRQVAGERIVFDNSDSSKVSDSWNPNWMKTESVSVNVSVFTHIGFANNRRDYSVKARRGGMGIGTDHPSASMHIYTNAANHRTGTALNSFSSTSALGYPVFVEVTSNAIKHNNLADNSSSSLSAPPSGYHWKNGVLIQIAGETGGHYMSFFNHNNVSNAYDNYDSLGRPQHSLHGSIQSADGNGVQFVSEGADYAEYIPKLDEDESIQIGDVVGVFNGRISKRTDGADQVLAISSDAIVAGNAVANLDNHELVAFLGQVRVNVTGPVTIGDYILASGSEDGTAKSVSLENIAPDDLHLIIGRALESQVASSGQVKVLMGFPDELDRIVVGLQELEQIRSTINRFEQENATLNEEFQSVLAQNDAVIKRLRDLLKKDDD